MEELKECLMETSDCFYQDRVEEGMQKFLSMVQLLAGVPEIGEQVNPLFDAIERRDYILAADIMVHEMSEKL